jgi:hypothetical protein
MAALAAIVFILSLLGIGLLFTLKYREESAGRILMPEAIREVGDERALAFKDFLAQCRSEASQWAPRLARASRLAMHDAALGVAAFARILRVSRIVWLIVYRTSIASNVARPRMISSSK